MKREGLVVSRRGLVMEIQGQQAVVLTADGDFCRIASAPNMTIGQEVTFDASVLTSPRQIQWFHRFRTQRSVRRSPLNKHRMWSVVGSAAAVVVIAAGTWVYSGLLHSVNAHAYAWVSIDLNPSADVGLTRSLKVVAAKGTDADGVAMVDALHLTGMNLAQATQAIVNYAQGHAQLGKDDAILVSVSPVKDARQAQSIQSAAEEDMKTALAKTVTAPKQKQSVSVYSIAVPRSVWKAADSAHISPGRLMSVLVAAQEGRKTGLMDVQGKQLGQVWSDPKAQSALKRIQTSDDVSLTSILQSLADEGFIGKTIGTVGQQPAVNSTGTANSVAENTVLSTGENTVSGDGSAGKSNNATNRRGTGALPDLSNVTSAETADQKSVGKPLTDHGPKHTESTNDSETSKVSQGSKGPGKSNGHSPSDPKTATNATSATNAPSSDKRPGGVGKHKPNHDGSIGNGAAQEKESQTGVTIHIGDDTYTIPLKSSELNSGDEHNSSSGEDSQPPDSSQSESSQSAGGSGGN